MNDMVDELDGDPEGELYHDAESEGPGEDGPPAEDADAGEEAEQASESDEAEG